MTKQEFLTALRKSLASFPTQETEDRLDFYSEMIDDRVEEGLSEGEAIAQIGSVEDVAAQIIADIPLLKIVRKRMALKGKLKAWYILLMTIGSPVWIPLLIAAFAVMLSIYAVLWSVVASVWAVFASLIGSAFGAFVAGGIFAVGVSAPTGIAMLGVGLVCAGLAILAFFGCKAATNGIARLTKTIAVGIKKCFVKKERT